MEKENLATEMHLLHKMLCRFPVPQIKNIKKTTHTKNKNMTTEKLEVDWQHKLCILRGFQLDKPSAEHLQLLNIHCHQERMLQHGAVASTQSPILLMHEAVAHTQ